MGTEHLLLGLMRDPNSHAAQVLTSEADLYQAEKIAPEHLLLGILREGEGFAMQVLLTLSRQRSGRRHVRAFVSSAVWEPQGWMSSRGRRR